MTQDVKQKISNHTAEVSAAPEVHTAVSCLSCVLSAVIRGICSDEKLM